MAAQRGSVRCDSAIAVAVQLVGRFSSIGFVHGGDGPNLVFAHGWLYQDQR